MKFPVKSAQIGLKAAPTASNCATMKTNELKPDSSTAKSLDNLILCAPNKKETTQSVGNIAFHKGTKGDLYSVTDNCQISAGFGSFGNSATLQSRLENRISYPSPIDGHVNTNWLLKMLRPIVANELN
jgi:hypothetical protein